MEGPRRPHTQPFKITICKLLLLYLIKNKTCWPPRPCLTRRDKGGVKALLPCCPQGLCWNQSIAGSQPSKVDISSPKPFRWALQRWACLVWAVKWVVTVELRPGNSSLAQPGQARQLQLCPASEKPCCVLAVICDPAHYKTSHRQHPHPSNAITISLQDWIFSHE